MELPTQGKCSPVLFVTWCHVQPTPVPSEHVSICLALSPPPTPNITCWFHRQDRKAVGTRTGGNPPHQAPTSGEGAAVQGLHLPGVRGHDSPLQSHALLALLLIQFPTCLTSCVCFLDCGQPYFYMFIDFFHFLLLIIIFFALFLLSCSFWYMSILYKLRAVFQCPSDAVIWLFILFVIR